MIETPSRSTSSNIPAYLSLDAWRGLAAIWVVMVHACLPAISSQFPELEKYPLYSFSLLGGLGVQLFFVISGYCIANAAFNTRHRQQSVIHFLTARLRRIYPPYWLTVVVSVLFSALALLLVSKGLISNSGFSKMRFFEQDLRFYFSTITLTQLPLHSDLLLTVFWTLNYEIAFYGVVAASLYFTYRISVEFLFDLLNNITIISLVWMLCFKSNAVFPFNYWPQFGLGVLVFDVVSNRSGKRRLFYFYAAQILTIAYAMSLRSEGSLGHPSLRCQYLLCSIFSVLLILIHRVDGKLIKIKIVQWMCWLGSFSYSIYLTHLICLGAASQVGKKIHLSADLYWLSFLLQILSAVAFARIFYILCERPFLNKKRFSESKAVESGSEPRSVTRPMQR